MPQVRVHLRAGQQLKAAQTNRNLLQKVGQCVVKSYASNGNEQPNVNRSQKDSQDSVKGSLSNPVTPKPLELEKISLPVSLTKRFFSFVRFRFTN